MARGLGESQAAELRGNKKGAGSLLPNSHIFIENNMNVLLVGLHGTGKTETINDIAHEHGLKVKYYSCATLDPHTDLVGIPVPQKVDDGEGGQKTILEYVRPTDIDEAELIFFDELNRAHPKVLNAVMEIIQFGTINGTPLPKLRCCWGAINPPGQEQDYEVDELDAALLDRFDFYYEMKPRVDAQYMANYVPMPIAQAFSNWWNDHYKKDDSKYHYVSPRRLNKMAIFYHKTKNFQMMLNMFPMAEGAEYDVTKLKELLQRAEGRSSGMTNAMGAGVPEEWAVPRREIARKLPELAEFLKANPDAFETHSHICNEIAEAIGGEKFVSTWGEVVENLNPALMEGVFEGFHAQKQMEIRRVWNDKPDTFKDAHPNLKNLLEKKGS